VGFIKQAQGAALCHYLLLADNGAYRVKLAGVLRTFFLGDASPDDLPKALGKSCEEIEKELDAFMKDRVAKE
jgi:hypothetical protein